MFFFLKIFDPTSIYNLAIYRYLSFFIASDIVLDGEILKRIFCKKRGQIYYFSKSGISKSNGYNCWAQS